MRRGGPEYRSQAQQDADEAGYGDENIGIEEQLYGVPWSFLKSENYKKEIVGILSKAAEEAKTGIEL